MSEFEAYVQRYAKGNNISVEEAKQHALVKEVEKHYNGTDKDVNKWW